VRIARNQTVAETVNPQSENLNRGVTLGAISTLKHMTLLITQPHYERGLPLNCAI